MSRGVSVPDLLSTWQGYGLDLRNRRVMFHASIDSIAHSEERSSGIGIDHVIRSLLWLDGTPGRIELWINSAGGDVCEAWGLYDVIRTAQNPVLTIGFGNVSSAACLILAAGTGVRYVMPSCSFMWHQGTTGVDADLNFRDARERMRWEEAEQKRWTSAMVRHTSKPFRYWEAKANGELWLDAEQMIEHGVADEIWKGPLSDD